MNSRFYYFCVAILVALTVFFQYQNNLLRPLSIAGQKDGQGGIYAQKQMGKKKVYLTFDDGPSKNTDEILDILKKNHVKATFFVVARTSEKNRKRYQRMILEGHTLGMHSYCHDYQVIYSSVSAFARDLDDLSILLERITDVKPYVYRFPGGSSNHCSDNIRPFIRYVNKKGLLYFDWNAQSDDAIDFHLTPEQLNNRILKDVRCQDTSIVLMHDLAEAKNTVRGLDPLIKTLKKEGYDILPITKNTKQIHHVSVDK